MTPLTVLDFDHVFKNFEAPVMRFDCGKMCAPLNGGQPVCCTTEQAIPVMQKPEWKLLRERTDLWHKFKPRNRHEKEVLAEMSDDCVACECKGAAHCERENRSLSCRTFPFFPYITRDDHFVGLSYYWSFEDRCWVLSNLKKVEKEFVDQMVASYDFIFESDPEERETMRDWSASMRRVFSRWERPIPLLTRDATWMMVLPRGEGVRVARDADFEAHGPYRSEKAYRKAVLVAERAAGG